MSEKKWDYFPHIWSTEAKYLSWIRGQIRQIWKGSPQRSEFIKSRKQRLPAYDENGETLKYKNGKEKLFVAYVCECCGTVCYDKDGSKNVKTYAVDHKQGNHSLRSFDEAPGFFDSILRVRLEDLQILCKDCHDIKTYAEKYDVSLLEAGFIKTAIALEKSKEDKQFFIDRNLSIPSNIVKRREGIINILRNEYEKNET